MKKILLLIAMMLMIVNSAFAMTGVIEQQTINGVHTGMSPDEVVAKWGQPIAQEGRSYYFKPGGLRGQFYQPSKGMLYLDTVFADNNPQIVLKPSGVAIGMSEEEVIRRLGKPDKELSQYYNETHGFCVQFVYREPEIKNYAGLKGHQDVSVWVGASSTRQNEGRVVAIWLSGSYY